MWFGAGAAVKVTTVPEETLIVQVVPQFTPAGLDVIFPVPAPSFAMVNVSETGGFGVSVEVLEPSSPLQAASNMAKPAANDINVFKFSPSQRIWPCLTNYRWAVQVTDYDDEVNCASNYVVIIYLKGTEHLASHQVKVPLVGQGFPEYTR